MKSKKEPFIVTFFGLVVAVLACIGTWLAVPQIQRLISPPTLTSPIPIAIVTDTSPTSMIGSIYPPTDTPKPVLPISTSEPTNPPEPTNTSEPALTPKPTDTPEPTNTSEPTIAPTPTDTQLGTVLNVGDTWRKGTLLLTLSDYKIDLNPSFDCNVSFGFHIENLSSSQIIVSIRSDQFSVEDNLGNQWRKTGVDIANTCPWRDFKTEDVMDPGGTFPTWGYSTFKIGYWGNLTDRAVDYVIVTVNDLLGFNGSKWKVPISN